MAKEHHSDKKIRKKRSKKIFTIVTLEILILLILFGSYRLYQNMKKNIEVSSGSPEEEETEIREEEPEQDLTQEEKNAIADQQRIQKEIAERDELIAKADRLALGYDYDGAIELIKNYQGSEGNYQIYPTLVQAIERLKTEKDSLVLYGGSYDSITKINHIFFHSLVADNAKAFDGDNMSKGYNMYMTTISEFEKIIQKMYDDGYVLVRMSDLTNKVTQDDGTTKYEENEIYLREGKKPFVISQDDVNYYEYMTYDGFASRIVVGEDGKPTCEMILDDGSTVTGAFDMVPILDQSQFLIKT
jgi:hypothetical protein